MIYACQGLEADCTHTGLTLYYCTACRSHGCRHMWPVVCFGVRAERLPPRPRRPDPRGPWLRAEHWLVVEQPAGGGAIPVRRFGSVMTTDQPCPVLMVWRGLN